MLLLTVLIGCGDPDLTPRAEPGPHVAVHVAPPASRSSVGPIGLPVSIVDCLGAGNFTTIQAAIDAAPREGWIEVRPCTYKEAVDFRGKTLWVASSGGSAVTTLDSDGRTAIMATHAEADGTAFVGFTVNSNVTGADVDHSALRLQDVVFASTGGQYVIDAEGADLELEGVVFAASNDASDTVIIMDRGAITVARSTIACGAANRGLFLEHGSAFLDEVTIDCRGAGEESIEHENTVGRIQRSVIRGPSVWLSEDDHPEDQFIIESTVISGDMDITNGSVSVRNSVIVASDITLVNVSNPLFTSNVFLGGGCSIRSDLPIVADYNDFFDNVGWCDGTVLIGTAGNISADPLFTNAAIGDYTLQAGSPLVDVGNPDSRYLDPDRSRNDIGLTGGRFSVLGGW